MRGHVLSLAIFLASAHAAALGARIESVELVPGDAGRDELRVTADQPANFTSFKLNQPTRIVVDFPETTGSAAKGTSDVGLVRRWGLERLGDDATPVVRLTVELREDADYTLSADGSRILLRLQPARGRPLVALDEKERATAAARKADAERAEREKAARLDAERVAREKAEVAAREEAERLAREKAAVAAREEAERLAREKAEVAAREEEARVAREKAALAARDEEKRVAREKAEIAAREEAERVAAREKAAFLRAEAERIGREKADRVRAERAVVAALPVARVTKPASVGALAALQQVSFRGSSGVARLVLRTSREVTYEVQEEPGRLVLVLEGTSIPLAANRLPLDTRFFGTTVTRVVPREDRAGRRTLLTLELAGPARHELTRTGDGLALVVEGPAAAAPTVVAGEPDGWQ